MQGEALRLRVEFLGNLSFELKTMRINNVGAFNRLAELDGQEALKLSDELLERWEDLDRCLPQLGHCGRLWTAPKLDRRIALTDMVADMDMARFFPDSSGEIWSKLTLPPNLQGVEIWSDADNFYWGNTFFCLHMWQQVINASLVSVEWVGNPETVGFVMNWKGAFRSIESLPVKDEETETEYWTVSYQIEGPICLAETSDALLLSAQIVSRRGGNTLIPVGVHNGYLAMRLNMLRADKLPACPPEALVSENVVEQLIDRAVARVLSRYAKASERVETALLQEIERLEPYTLQVGIVRDYLPKLRETLDELRSVREIIISDT